jgi:hypothetical protein
MKGLFFLVLVGVMVIWRVDSGVGQTAKPRRAPRPAQVDCREIGGTNYNVGHLAAWIGTVNSLSDMRHRPMTNWFRIDGVIRGVTDAGLVVSINRGPGTYPNKWAAFIAVPPDGDYLVVRHPRQLDLAEGERVSCFAMRGAVTRLAGWGSLRTFDFGKPTNSPSGPPGVNAPKPR